ncbi:retrovirus-related Pol polyprotein from transposon 17.6 [Trichonephila clavipes]|nr:retrovirus-related Pol polyprotein from transposon 17.6 [Trichonephila clavipes]
MSILDLKSGYFQLAVSPKDIEKTAFITRNGTFAFLRMPFGLSGAAPNFQKAIDILKPVVGRFVMVYMDDVIITSPSFNEHIDNLNQVFTLLNPVGNMDGSQISCAALPALALNSREQLIPEQREDPELGQIYRYLENPDDGSVNTTVCEGPGDQDNYERNQQGISERRPVQSKQATAVRPCPYYLRSRVKQPEGIPENRRSIGIDSIPQNNIRRRSLSMEALGGDPVDRSE